MFEQLAFVGLTLLALDAVRNAVWLALFSLVVLPRLLDDAAGSGRRAEADEPDSRDWRCSPAWCSQPRRRLQTSSWFTQSSTRPRPRARPQQAAGAHGRIFANESYADWLVFEHPQLAGRIAYDSRFELLTSRQLRSVIEFRNLVAGWRSTIRGYSILVLNKVDDAKPIQALLKAREARVVMRRGPVVVLQRR